MNNQIVNQLIFINNEYEKLLKNFPENTDISKVFEFECEYYVQKLTDNVVPLIYNQLNINTNDKIESYFPYIKSKYHGTIVSELKAIKINAEKKLYKDGNKIVNDFNSELLVYKSMQEEDKIRFLDSFYESNKEQFEEILNKDVLFFFKVVGELRNPKMQYIIINKDKSFMPIMIAYLNQIEKSDFEKFLKASVFYPTNIEMDEYYKKWIGKDKIHVKFLKAHLGTRYEYAKMFTKMLGSGKKPKNTRIDN